MLKLAARTFDVYDDEDMSVAKKVASSLGSAVVADRDTVEALHDNAFGLLFKTAGGMLRRRFPLHDLDSVKLSRAYFDETRVSLPEQVASMVDTKIAAAEQFHGIRDVGLTEEQVMKIGGLASYVNAEELQPERKKVAFENPVWGLTIEGKNYFPLHDADLIKVAISRFSATAGDLQPHEKFEYARAIYKQAEVLKVEIEKTSSIHTYTNDEVNVDALNLALDERKRIMKAAGLNTEIVDQLRLAAGCLPDRGDIEKDASWHQRLTKLAAIPRLPADRVVSTLQGIDKFAGFGMAHYNRGLPDPFASCFKRADALSPTMVDGVDLSKIDPTELSNAFDADFVKEFSQNPVQVYSSLPDPVKVMVRGLAERAMSTEPAGAVQQPAPRAMAGGDPEQRLNSGYTNGVGSNSF